MKAKQLKQNTIYKNISHNMFSGLSKNEWHCQIDSKAKIRNEETISKIEQ